MNIKSLFFSAIFMVASPLYAMAPGTVIDPLNHSGQFTVVEPQNLIAANTSITQSAKSCAQSSSDLFKTKGLPVLISSAASAMPWWALTTGTGYLLISQSTLPQEGLANALMGGSSYAVGEKFSAHASTFYQLALCAACGVLSYAYPASAVQEVCFAVAQSLTCNSVMQAAQAILQNPATQIPQQEINSHQKNDASVFKKSIDTLKTMMPGICFGIMQTQDTNTMLRILLYEQAYRLAQSGCTSVQEFLRR